MALGRCGAIGFGEESTYGTAVARANWRPLISGGLTRNLRKVMRPDLHCSTASAMRRGHFDQVEESGGPLSMLVTYDNMGMLLKHLLGSVSTAGVGPYTHTYDLAATLPTGLTIEMLRGTSTNSEVFEGCKLNSGTFNVAAGGQMTLDLDVIAETAAARAAAGSASFASTEEVVLHKHSGQFGFNAANYDLIDMRLEVANSLVRRQFLGSNLTQEPLRGDFMDVTLTVTVEAVDAIYTAFLADTQADASITFTSGTKSAAFTVHNAWIESQSDPVNDAGIIRQTVTFRGESDGTDEGLQIAVVNDNASGTAN